MSVEKRPRLLIKLGLWGLCISQVGWVDRVGTTPGLRGMYGLQAESSRVELLGPGIQLTFKQ
jgi:hypothetical protein